MSGIGNVPQLADRNHRLFLQALKERVVKLQTQAGGAASSESAAALQQQINVLKDRIRKVEQQIAEINQSGGTTSQPSDDFFRANAGAALGAHRAIYIDGGVANYADASNGTAQRVAGVSISSASAGYAINYRTEGEIVEPSWSWSAGSIYLGVNGVLTQTPPSSGTIVELAVATASTRIIVRIGLPILLQ